MPADRPDPEVVGELRRDVERRLPARLARLSRRVFPPHGERLASTLSARWRAEDRTAAPNVLAFERAEATHQLLSRLDPEDVSRLERRIASDPSPIALPAPPTAPVIQTQLATIFEEAAPFERRRLLLALGVFYGDDAVLAKTGLSADQPPDEVHAMGRGALASGGSFYHADLVADALASAGAPLAGASRVLDFGSSSGRVVRVLAAAFDQVEWHGCDPNAEAVAWADENLDRASFRVSPQRPPLPYEGESFDAVFAISVWSHLSEPAALAWFHEARRVVRPGGHLVFTAAGYQAMAYNARRKLWSPVHFVEMRDGLYSRGHWFAPHFANRADWGLAGPDWGLAYMTAEWLLSNVCPAWSLVEYASGRNEGEQDVIVLRRA